MYALAGGGWVRAGSFRWKSGSYDADRGQIGVMACVGVRRGPVRGKESDDQRRRARRRREKDGTMAMRICWPADAILGGLRGRASSGWAGNGKKGVVVAPTEARSACSRSDSDGPQPQARHSADAVVTDYAYACHTAFRLVLLPRPSGRPFPASFALSFCQLLVLRMLLCYSSSCYILPIARGRPDPAQLVAMFRTVAAAAAHRSSFLTRLRSLRFYSDQRVAHILEPAEKGVCSPIATRPCG